jgi:predicted ATPase/Tfp pilus assembly protein PilF
VEGERTRLRRMYVDVLRGLAKAREAAGDPAGAAGFWATLAAEAPLDADAALRRMQALADAGDRASALEHAREFQERLRKELEADPDPDVEELAERLRSGAATAPVASADVPAAAPQSRPAVPGQVPPPSLPVSPTPLIGRAGEAEKVRDTLLRNDVRVVTLTGPGGVGKTRLALEVARTFLSDHAYEVAFVALAPLTSASLVLGAIAGALGVRETGPVPLRQALAEDLRNRRLLLVLDNFEHVTEAADDVAELVAAAARMKVLVTSRAVLRIRSEQEFPVAPLSVPDARARGSAEGSIRFGAIQLFVARARAVKPDFALTDENASTVAEICARLDGLPLAIELAAARTRVLSPASILERLGKRLQLLTGGPRDLPARQQTLRSAIDWSYGLLTEPERSLFRRLSVFRGGARFEAIEAISGAGQSLEDDPLDVLDSLIGKSLLVRADGQRGEPRFGMLETIAEFALEKLLEDAREAEAILREHTALYQALAEEAEPRLVGGEQVAWLGRLDEEHDNMRAVLQRGRERGDAETMLRLCSALWRFWWMRGHLSEGRSWTREALAADTTDLGRWRGRALLAASALALFQGDLKEARASAERALVDLEAADDSKGVATAHSRLGQQAWRHGDYESARNHYERSLEIERRLGNMRTVADLLFNLGSLEADQSRFDEANRLYDECRALNREVGDRELDALVLLNLGLTAYRTGELKAARERLMDGITIARSVGGKHHLAGALNTLGLVARDLGDFEGARSYLEESYSLQVELGDRVGRAHCAHSLGALALRGGSPESAAPLLRESLEHFRDVGVPPPTECISDLAELALLRGSVDRAARLLALASRMVESSGQAIAQSDRRRFEEVVAQTRARMGDTAWDKEWRLGRDLNLDEVVESELREAEPVLPTRRVGDEGAPDAAAVRLDAPGYTR